jgi:hypothetical protein
MFSGSSGAHLMAALRFLRLIDEREQPTPRFRALVAARDNREQRIAILKTITAECYHFVFSNPDDLANTTYLQMEDKFMANFSLKPEVGRKCLKFFYGICTAAGIPLSTFVTKKFRSERNSSGTKGLTKRASTKAITKMTSQKPAANPVLPLPTNGSSEKGSNLKYLLDKFPAFDVTWPDDVKAKWFDHFGNLMSFVINNPDK